MNQIVTNVCNLTTNDFVFVSLINTYYENQNDVVLQSFCLVICLIFLAVVFLIIAHEYYARKKEKKMMYVENDFGELNEYRRKTNIIVSSLIALVVVATASLAFSLNQHLNKSSVALEKTENLVAPSVDIINTCSKAENINNPAVINWDKEAEVSTYEKRSRYGKKPD